MTAAPFLELTRVSKRFGETQALVDCDLAVSAGEFLTLLGPSGCGKTTTLRLIAGFLTPDAGEIRIGEALLSSPTTQVPPERRNIGMVFQSFAVWPHMSVYDNIALPLRIRGIARSEVETRCAEVLRLCRLEAQRDRDPHQLSGGQLQRVALARSLVYRPALILLDEPLSNLDASLREEVRRELHTIHKMIGGTFILVTHDQVEAMSMSDRVVVMNHGRIEQIGTPREIYQSPRTDFVAQFVGAANMFHGEVTGGDAANGVRVRVEGLELVAARRANAPAEGRATIVIHPEAISLLRAAAPADGPNVFNGKVLDLYFLGRVQEVMVEVAGLSLRVAQVRGQSYDSGEAVKVMIAPGNVILLAP
jgi:ABC-type Fe3+/spermidine/putrescine transport system ATPase subunit